jgi:hypothetical protein
MTDNDAISTRANFWRGDRALGGRLSVTSGRLQFRPHGLERSLGGNDEVDIALHQITRLSKAPRSLRVPRERLIVRTIGGQDLYFLVPKLADLLARLKVVVQDAGIDVRTDFAEGEDSASTPPESQPDDSAVMNWISSGWIQLVGLLLFSIPLLVALLNGPRNPPGLALLAALIPFQIWRMCVGFRRTSRLKVARRRQKRIADEP